jgi:hypothetical protein
MSPHDGRPNAAGQTNDERWNRLRALFAEAQEMSAADRSAFLDHELAGDRELRAELERLLASAASAGSFLAPHPGAETRDAAAPRGPFGASSW